MRQSLLLKQITISLCLVLVFLTDPNKCLAETLPEKMQKLLSVKAGFGEEELKTFYQGQMLAKLLSVKDEREVAVCGITNIKAPLDVVLKAFQDTLSRQNKSSVMSLGDFSQEPVIKDFQTLNLEKGDIENLKNCRVGNCDLRLSAQMIERFQKEVDWNAADYSAQANLLFRQILLDYLQNYLTNGNQALIDYNHQRNSISLSKEYDSLLENLLWLDEFAPEFSEYLKNFPRSELSDIRKSLTWTKIKFGLKPVVVITQTITYKTEKDGVSQILSVSKQIYASRYFDASLGLTALIKFSDSNSYLFYTNHSRSSSLGGMLSGFKRNIVEQEAIDKIKPLLQNTKSFAEANLKNSSETNGSTDNQDFTIWGFLQNYWVWMICVMLALIGLFWFGKNRLKP